MAFHRRDPLNNSRWIHLRTGSSFTLLEADKAHLPGRQLVNVTALWK